MAGDRKTNARVAQERAREARASVLAARAERERQVEAAVASFFAGQQEHEDAEEALSVAAEQMREAVVTLVGLEEPVDVIAAMCGISDVEVKRLRRAQGRASQGSAPDGVSPSGSGDSVADLAGGDASSEVGARALEPAGATSGNH